MCAARSYKDAATGGRVSVKQLREKLDKLDYMIFQLKGSVDEVKRELHAIIEEIGEEW